MVLKRLISGIISTFNLRAMYLERRYYFLKMRYAFTPRYTPEYIKTPDVSMHMPDAASFLSAYREIFIRNIYKFPSPRSDPHIIDCGANIGVSVLYFKKLYPDAKIVAFEADPKIYAYLKKNIELAKLGGVELVNRAVWTEETTVTFWSEGADAGRIETGTEPGLLSVPTVRFSDYLKNENIDMLKMDIEGAEVEVLQSCRKYLHKISCCFVEFHSFYNRPQSLGMLLEMFEQAGFRVHIHPVMTQPSPFMKINPSKENMDMQLNLFFYKNSHS
jgi:FkbM family methyltransferase